MLVVIAAVFGFLVGALVMAVGSAAREATWREELEVARARCRVRSRAYGCPLTEWTDPGKEHP